MSGDRLGNDDVARTSPSNSADIPTEHDPIVVGVGASAGGLEAFRNLFTAMPTDSGLAFVLVQHLDPDHQSLMADLLTRYTTMPVVQVEDGMRIQANQVYIIPPNTYMTIDGATLQLSTPTERRGVRLTIDSFLRSLAEDRRERAICIILSGTGSDGSLGLKAIKERGGMVMVQEPSTAAYDGMPRSAVATGLADYVLPIDQMPAALLSYVRHFYFHAGDLPQHPGDLILPDTLISILDLVRAKTNHDFRPYKRNTLVRRIERRMSLHQFVSAREYLRMLKDSNDEVQALFKDLLISVTNFFRDPEAFATLEQSVLEPLVRAHPEDVPLRVWVPGCATGEEAYSLAICLSELLRRIQKSSPLQIFATDIDEQALETARLGLYPESIANDIAPERLQRYFMHEQPYYKASKALRDSVVFAAQNLTSDPPFSKLDLISCRNLLIYLDPTVQKRVIALFHFALKEEGVLFLGNAETIGPQQGLFAPIEKKWRIYRRLPVTQRFYPDFGPMRDDGGSSRQRGSTMQTVGRRNSLSSLVQQQLLNKYAPIAVLINNRYEALYIHNPDGNHQPFLKIASGEPSNNLFTLLRDDLRASVRTAILRVQREAVPVTLQLGISEGNHHLDIVIAAAPFRSYNDGDLVLISFEEAPAPASEPGSNGTQSPAIADVVRQLEHELAMTREDLQSTIEELETSNEELKAANEEVMSMNEELQSTNEELETSKEELQSLNEELITLNSQLHEKVSELESASNDLLNLLSSTAIATLFLDVDFCIKRFTPAITQLFNLIDGDIGRSISDIVPKFRDDDLLDDAKGVLDTLQPAHSEIQTHQGRWFIRRILPYRTLDRRIDGVVITFTEITEIKRVEEALRLSEQRFQAALANSPITIFHQDTELRYTWINNPVGYSSEEIIGRTDEEVNSDPEQAAVLRQLKTQVLQSGTGLRTEVLLTIDGVHHAFDMNIEALRNLEGAIVGVTCAATDITQRKEAEAERLHLLERAEVARNEAERAVHLRDTFLTIASHELKTPLTILLGNTQALQVRLKRTNQLSERDQRAITMIVRNALRLNQLINLLLDVSRIERGQLTLNLKPLDLSTLVSRVIADVQIDRPNNKIELEQPHEPLHINGDELRLEQVFYNLIDNAIKYGQEAGNVRVKLWGDGNIAYVTVSDDGIGVPLEQQGRIFDQFARATNAEAQKINGMGVGLYIVHNIVLNHGGTITIESKENIGSTFTLKFPALEKALETS